LEREETSELKEMSVGVAAFFDLDGTLVALPSRERKLFRILQYQRLIGTKNYLLWLKEAIRLMPRGLSAVLHENKMYLRGVRIFDECGETERNGSSRHKDGHQAGGQASAPLRRNPRLPVPTFFVQATERVAWHAKQGHEIVLVSGTPEPLARNAARALEAELEARGIAVTVRVRATRLEEMNGIWTGRILGDAMFGKAKVRAAKSLALELHLDLARCYGYGDGMSDRWLLAEVGKPVAVNPSEDLAAMARARGWPILVWEEKEIPTQRRRERRGIAEKKEESSGIA
jgi:HAD superfamily hydrolase (TIGR01490 family)